MKQVRLIIKTAFFDFRRNKLRTFLTSLGILIGVAAVVLILAFGLGLRAYIQEQFESLGSNLVFVIPGQFAGGGQFRPGATGSTKFTDKDLTNLRKMKEAKAVAGIFTKTVRASSSDESNLYDLFAATPEIFTVYNLKIDQGTLFTERDNDKRKKIVVLGPKVATEIFGSASKAIGKSISIENQGFSVVGVLEAKGGGGLGGRDFDKYIYTPHSSALQFNPSKSYLAFYVQLKTQDEIAMGKETIKTTMLKYYKDDEFSVLESTDILNSITSIFNILNSILVAIGAISLIVGGVGIMNIMFVTVTERIKEIGIRRAIGATKKDILLQFLIEATILSFLGGLMGLLLSVAIVLVVRRFFPAYIDIWSVCIALGVSSLVGIVFGVFPAKKAADLSPIDAIRYE